MYVLVRLAAYLALALTPTALLAGALFDPSGAPSGSAGIEGGLLLTGAVAVTLERERVLTVESSPFVRERLTVVAAVVCGAVVTHGLGVHLGLGAVLASALVGLLGGATLPKYDSPIYCGSFVGMASTAVFPSVAYVAMAGTVTGVTFVAAERVFAGVGGKLGTLALFGCVSTVALTDADFAAGQPLAWNGAVLVLPVAVGAAVATAFLSRRLEFGVVVGSAVVGVVAGLALPPLVPAVGETLAAVAFCASFVGMSGPERLGRNGHFALAGGMCGVAFIVVSGAFVGAGGKLGTTAFISCIAVAGAEELLAR